MRLHIRGTTGLKDSGLAEQIGVVVGRPRPCAQCRVQCPGVIADAVTLKLTGNLPGSVNFELPAFVSNIASTSAGTVDNGAGAVTIPARTRSVTVTLAHARAVS